MEIALVYMVGGLSSRFKGEIKQFAQIGVNGETLIECSMNQALYAGFSKIVFIVSEKTESAFRDFFGENYKGVPVYYAFQDFDSNLRDKPWGTADALCSAKSLLDCPFVVCNGDDLYGKESFEILVNHLKREKNGAVVGFKLMDALPSKGRGNRAIFKINEKGFVLDFQEIFDIGKDNLSDKGYNSDELCSMNIYALNPEILRELNVRVESFKFLNRNDRRVECLLPNEISGLIKSGKVRVKIYPTSSNWIGVTYPEDVEIVRKVLGKFK